jgi:hypothetical protein
VFGLVKLKVDENFNPPDFIGIFNTHTKRIPRIEIFAQRRDRKKWDVLKPVLRISCLGRVGHNNKHGRDCV